MLDRDQVLHVARLARLELSEDEVEHMASELSHVLDHIEKIRELDLEGVPPTSHVVDVVNALRPDEPVPCLPRRGRAGGGARTGRGRLRSPESGCISGMTNELIELTAAQAAESVRSGEVVPGGAVRGLPRPRRRR